MYQQGSNFLEIYKILILIQVNDKNQILSIPYKKTFIAWVFNTHVQI